MTDYLPEMGGHAGLKYASLHTKAVSGQNSAAGSQPAEMGSHFRWNTSWTQLLSIMVLIYAFLMVAGVFVIR